MAQMIYKWKEVASNNGFDTNLMNMNLTSYECDVKTAL